MSDVDKMLSLIALMELTGLGRTTVYDITNPKSSRYDATFPKKIKLSARRVGFKLSEVQRWIESRERAA
jgi:prophage regulatory protein